MQVLSDIMVEDDLVDGCWDTGTQMALETVDNTSAIFK